MDDLNTRMAAMTAEQRKAAIEAAQRSQSSKRYQEMERERKRRQLKTQGGQEKTSFFQSTKLALMNSGLIPLKKGKGKTYIGQKGTDPTIMYISNQFVHIRGRVEPGV